MADAIREALRILLNEIDDLSVLGKIPSLREAVDDAHTALAAEPPAPAVPDEVGEAFAELERRQENLNRFRDLREALAADPPAPDPREALAARPLLEAVARLGDCIGQHTVGEIATISDRAAAWLAENPPGRPVAIEPRGCPTPGACSCVEPPAPAEPDTDAVLDLAAIIRRVDGSNSLGAAALAEAILSHRDAASVFQPPAPAPAADGERDHVPGAGNMVPAAYAARLRQCPTHGQLPANALGCPECLRELREEVARLRGSTPPADGEVEELAQWLDNKGRGAWPCPDGFSAKAEAEEYEMFSGLTRAAALLRQLPPEGVMAVEYFHIASGARIVGEASEKWGECWNVYNSRHVNPCTEFRTVADAVAALQQARRQEVGDA